MGFYAYYAARNDIEYSVRKYANATVPSFAVVAEALVEHLAGIAPVSYGIIERTAFRAADAMRTLRQADAWRSRTEGAYGDAGAIFALSNAAAERMAELHAIIAAEFGCEGEEEEL